MTPVFPADPIVLVGPDGDRDDWLVERQQGLGGTDMAQIMGSSKYGTAIDVYERKLGREDEYTPEQEERMEAGRRMEVSILDWAAEREGWEIEHETLPKLVAVAEHPFLRASMDAVAWIADEPEPFAIVDAKCVGARQTPENLMLEYTDQLLFYMGVTGVHRAYIAALIGGQRLEIIPIEWDPDRWFEMRTKAIELWAHIQFGNRPSLDQFPPHNSILGDVYEGRKNSGGIEVNGEFGELVAEYRDLKVRERLVGKRLDELQALMKVQMGEYEHATIDGENAANWTVVHSTRVDRKKLEEEYPEVAKEIIKPSTYRRFTVPAKSHRPG